MTLCATNDTVKPQLQSWLEATAPAYGIDPATLVKASADAGFRCYYRVKAADGKTFIVMDAEGETPESFAAFCRIAAWGNSNLRYVRRCMAHKQFAAYKSGDTMAVRP